MDFMTEFECEVCHKGPSTTGDTTYRMKSTGAYRCLQCTNEPIEQKVLESAAAFELVGTEKH